ncbi:hypothetical protein BpHYR1_009829, partial [Brachionus plicatilis]
IIRLIPSHHSQFRSGLPFYTLSQVLSRLTEFQTIVRHILSRFGCWNLCEVFEGTSVRSCCDKQPCLLFLFGKGSVRSSESCVVDMT